MQVVTSVVTNKQTLTPAMAALALAVSTCAAHRTSCLPARLQKAWLLVPGWTATVLFALQPIAQLVGAGMHLYMPLLMPAGHVAKPASMLGHQSCTITQVFGLLQASLCLTAM